MEKDENWEPDRDNDDIAPIDIVSILNQDGDVNEYLKPSNCKKFRQLKVMRADKSNQKLLQMATQQQNFSNEIHFFPFSKLPVLSANKSLTAPANSFKCPSCTI